MNALLQFDSFAMWQVAGWTMLHFLWLGTLVGLVAFACRLLLRRSSADVRYAVALVSLAVLAALPVVIGAWLVALTPTQIELAASRPLDAEIVELNKRETMPTDAAVPGFAGGSQQPEFAPDASTRAWSANPRQSRELTGRLAILDSCIAYLPWLWLIGTPLTFMLLATGIIGAERLRHASRPIVDGPIAEACARLRKSLGVTRRVTIAVCERIATPVLVGVLRPIILLPPSALTGWSPDEIEMVLLHELAHVRRWDNLANLAQRLVESLLFFHPAVWVVSSWLRREREACCDAAVVERTNRPHAYAELLVAIASQFSEPGRPRPRFADDRGRGRPGSLAMGSAMAAGPLRARIRRILQLEDDPMLISGKSFACVMAILTLVASLVVVYLPSRGIAEESQTDETAPTKEAVELSLDAMTSAENDSQAVAEASSAVSARFPSLEDQKLADLAWRQLRLELEPVNDEELGHAQGRGYEGGVRVAALGSPSFPQNYIQAGDILVGLHVWPTRNMKDVVAVLHRGDLAELNPLKFYVLRPNRGADGQGGLVLEQVTGRIAVDAPVVPAASALPDLALPADPHPDPDSDFLVGTARGSLSSERGSIRDASRKNRSSLGYDGKPFDEWREIWRNELSHERRLEAVKALAAFAAAG